MGPCSIRLAVALLLIPISVALSGCGRGAASADPAPFLEAVDGYLQQNDMQLKVKDVRAGPVVTDRSATMTASLTHAELGGPSVVWEIRFVQAEDGRWVVQEHTVQ